MLKFEFVYLFQTVDEYSSIQKDDPFQLVAYIYAHVMVQ